MSKAIPVDVVFNILSFLPVESLLRFKCLSKCFCALIDSPVFINFHLNLSVKTLTNRSLIINDVYPPYGSIYAVDLDSFPDNMRPVKLDFQYMCVPFLRGGVELYGDIFGSCNGLVAMYDNKGITICNPYTKKHKFVRQFFTQGRKENGDYYFIVMVYSLSRDNVRRIGDLYTSDPISCDLYLYRYLNSVLVGSSLHWLGGFAHNRSSYHIILAFDLGNETFSEVPTPPGIDKDSNFTYNIAELGGCLSVINRHTYFDVDIWIMKECGVKESWTKLFSLSINKHQGFKRYSNWKPFCYTKMGDKVLMGCENERFHVLYDLKEQSVQRVDLFDPPMRYMTRTGFICLRSLVPLAVEV